MNGFFASLSTVHSGFSFLFSCQFLSQANGSATAIGDLEFETCLSAQHLNSEDRLNARSGSPFLSRPPFFSQWFIRLIAYKILRRLILLRNSKCGRLIQKTIESTLSVIF